MQNHKTKPTPRTVLTNLSVTPLPPARSQEEEHNAANNGEPLRYVAMVKTDTLLESLTTTELAMSEHTRDTIAREIADAELSMMALKSKLVDTARILARQSTRNQAELQLTTERLSTLQFAKKRLYFGADDQS